MAEILHQVISGGYLKVSTILSVVQDFFDFATLHSMYEYMHCLRKLLTRFINQLGSVQATGWVASTVAGVAIVGAGKSITL